LYHRRILGGVVLIHERSEIYKNAGYGQKEVGFGQSPALLLVDFQNAFIGEKFITGRSPMIKQAAEHTSDLLKLARAQNIPVIYTVVAYRNDQWDIGNWKTDIGWITLGSEAAEVTPILKPKEDEPVVIKKYPSAFFGTEVLSLLTTKHVDTLIVTGCTTSGCIRASVIDSFSYGFKTIIPEECVGDQSQQQHDSNLFDVNARYADVVTKMKVEEYLQSLKVNQAVMK
jgi:maleamate amidohydrolase